MNPTYSFDLSQFDFESIHAWLSGTYWSPGISRKKVEQGFCASTLCIGAFHEKKQVGVARCISDTTRFGYIADVYVEDGSRKQGIARQMVKLLMEHQLVQEVESWYLLTNDAHGVYAALGYKPSEHPERLMVCRTGKPSV